MQIVSKQKERLRKLTEMHKEFFELVESVEKLNAKVEKFKS